MTFIIYKSFYKNILTSLEGAIFPNSLEWLSLMNNPIKDVSEFKFPDSLEDLLLDEGLI